MSFRSPSRALRVACMGLALVYGWSPGTTGFNSRARAQDCLPGVYCEGSSTDSSEETDEESRPKRGGGFGLGEAIIAIIAIAATLVVVDSLTGKKWVKAEDLDKKGPRFPNRQALGRFQVQGYAKGGWPLVVDLTSTPGTRTWLELRTKGQDDGEGLTMELPGEGRRLQFVRVPEQWGGGQMQIARYSIKSGVVRPARKMEYKPLVVYGLGAGPRAIQYDSLADLTMFSNSLPGPMRQIYAQRARPPVRRQVPGLPVELRDIAPVEVSKPGDVAYAVVSRRLFDRSKVEVLRMPKKAGGEMKLVRDQQIFPLQPGRFPGNWTILGVRPSPAAGLYAMQVRAWLVGRSNDERDWTGAFSPSLVRVR